MASQAHAALVVFAYIVSRWVVLMINCPVIVHLFNGLQGQGDLVGPVVRGF